MKTLIKLIVFVQIVGIPLVMRPGFADGFNLPKITLFYLLTLLLLGVWYFSSIKGKSIEIRLTSILVPAALLVITTGVSVLLSLNTVQSVWGQYRYHTFGWFPLLSGFLTWFIVSQVHEEQFIYKTMLLSGCLVAVTVVIVHFVNVYSSVKITSTFGSPIYCSAFLVPIFILSWEHFLDAKSGVLEGAMMLIIAAGLLLSGSRGAWIASALSVVLCSALMPRKTNYRKRMGIGICVLAMIVLLFITGTPSSASKINTIFHKDYSSDISRVEGWKTGMRIAAEYPLTGTGLDNFPAGFQKLKTLEYVRKVGPNLLQAHAHNEFIQYAATTGLAGLGAYLFLWVTVFRTGMISARKDVKKAAILAGLTGMLIFNQFNNGMVASLVIFWILAGMLSLPENEKTVRISLPYPTIINAVMAAVLIVGAFIATRPYRAEAFFEKGQQEYIKGDLEAAVKHTAYALELHPVFDYYRTLQDYCLISAKKESEVSPRKRSLDTALVYAKENVSKDPCNPDAHYNLGAVYVWRTNILAEDDREKAARSFAASVQCAPYYIQGLSALAKLSNALGKHDQAQKLWNEILLIDPLNNEALRQKEATKRTGE